MQAFSPATTGTARKSVLAFVGLLAATAAAAVGAVLALVFAATVVVIAVMTSLVLALAGLAFKARRNLRAATVPASEDVIDARPVGGHSWVAYGWDRR